MGVSMYVLTSYSMYSLLPVFVVTLPSVPFLNEAGRVAASAPATGGHRVNPAWLPLSRRPSFLCLSLRYASGLLTAAGAAREKADDWGG